MNSEKYTLNKKDAGKIAHGALIALGGALLTYIAQVIVQTDFGVYTPIVVALSGVLINTAKKYLEGK